MTTSGRDPGGRPAAIFFVGLLVFSSLYSISMFLPEPVSADPSSRQDPGVWTSTKMWADDKLTYDAEVGDIWPGHPGNEVVVGGESNWTTMIYGHEDGWDAVRLFEEAWYVTNIAIGDADPDEPGLEMVNVGWHGNVSMVYWDDAASRWRHKELVNGLDAGLDWGYGVSIGDFDPRFDGNEVAVTDDLGQLMLIRKVGDAWTTEVIWQEGGPGILDPYLDTVHLADFDPEHDGEEILVAGGSKWLTEIYYNGSNEWAVKRLWRDRLAPVQVAVADILEAHDGMEIAAVGLTNNLTVLHWNGSGWEAEKVYTDGDVIYDVEVGQLVPGQGPHIITGGWSSNVITHVHDQSGWTSETVLKDEDFIFGVTIGDFDDLHGGNEIVLVDRSGIVTKLQYETPDFVLYAPSTEVSAAAGSWARFDLMVYSRAGFKEEVALEASGLPVDWTAVPSPGKVTPTGYSELAVEVPVDGVPGKKSFTLKGKSASKQHSMTLTVNVLPPGEKDFSLKATPSSQSVVADYSAKYTIVSEAINGFSQEIACSVSGLPDGAKAVWSSDRMTPSGSVTLEIKTVTTTPKGAHFLTIGCDGGGKDHTVTVSLTVKDANSPDFTMSLAPSTVEAVGSRSVEVTVNVISLFGFTDQVSLSVKGAPKTMTVGLSPEQVTPTGKSVLNITPSAALPKGTYYLEVTGTSDSLTHAASLRVDLNTMGDPDFVLQVFPGSTEVTASGSAFFNITVNPEHDFGAVVDLSVEGLPEDATAIFSPASLRPFEFATLEIKTLVSTPTGSHEVTMKGIGSGLERDVTVTLVVGPARPLLNLIGMSGSVSGIVDGQVVKYEVSVENIGLVNATEVEIELLVDGKVVDSAKVTLTPGSGDVVYLKWTAKEGTHNVTAKIVERPDIDILNGWSKRVVSVSGPMSLEGGFLALIVLMVVIIVVVVIVLGYLVGKKKGSEGEERPRKGLEPKKGAKKRGRKRS